MNLNPNAPRRPMLRYYGGGWTRAPWTISFIPRHDNWLDACCGAGSITLRKPVATLESMNDRDGRTVNFMRQLREHDEKLLRLINLTPWAKDEMLACVPVADDPLEDARRFFFLCWATVHGGPTGQYHSFRYQKSIESRFISPPYDAIDRDDLMVTAARLRKVQIFNRDALELIEKFRRQDAVIYFDPPYLPETRQRKHGYNHEPDVKWHIEAAKMLREARGPVLVAGYRTPLYERIYEDFGFIRVEREQATNGKSKAIECLWLSPMTIKRLEQDAEDERLQMITEREAQRQRYPLLEYYQEHD